MQSQIYTINEIAALLKVSYDAIYDEITKRRNLSAFKVGSDWRINQEDLDEYIERRKLKAKKFKQATI